MRSEEKENFRFVRPMMMALFSDYAEIIGGIRNEWGTDVAEWPLCLECPAVRLSGETDEAATSRLRQEFTGVSP